MPEYEVFPGIFFKDLKVNFFSFSIYQNKNNWSLVEYAKADPSIMYGWEHMLTDPGYIKFGKKILQQLRRRLRSN